MIFLIEQQRKNAGLQWLNHNPRNNKLKLQIRSKLLTFAIFYKIFFEYTDVPQKLYWDLSQGDTYQQGLPWYQLIFQYLQYVKCNAHEI